MLLLKAKNDYTVVLGTKQRSLQMSGESPNYPLKFHSGPSLRMSPHIVKPPTVECPVEVKGIRSW